MTRSIRAVILSTLAALTLVVPVARAAGPTFGTLSADAPLGGPTVFRVTISADALPVRVEALVSVPGDSEVSVLGAELTAAGTGAWTAEASLDGHILANTKLSYQFRATAAGGQNFDSPSADIVVTDDRFDWRTLSGPIVRLHWYSGDDAFARRALDIGERAVSNASRLLGVTETEPIDFFIYDDTAAFIKALGPGTRENVGGRAVASNRTMYGRILPSQVNDDWVDILVTHELTHLVFDTATHNVYHFAPHWLNEGVATYLSEGNSERWQAALAEGINNRTLIPLQGMGATFGSGDVRFDLGYAESESAVEYFVKTYGEPKLWQLVRSYAEGLSDDDAFTRATGADLAAFNEAWMESLGVTVPAEVGPQPGATGPLPPDWLGLPPRTAAPVVTPGVPGATPGVPGPTPVGPSDVPAPSGLSPLLLAGLLIVVVIAALAVVWAVSRRARHRQTWRAPGGLTPDSEPPAGPPPPPAWPPAG